MDKYVETYIKVNVHVDAAQRVWCKGEQLHPVNDGVVQKFLLPISKILFTFQDFKLAGARVDVVTLRSLAQQGAEGRWKENIEQRRKDGLPSNVYIANARTVEYNLAKGKPAPVLKYVGRRRDQITEVYDTVDEVVDAMSRGLWRKEFARGGRAKRRIK